MGNAPLPPSGHACPTGRPATALTPQSIQLAVCSCLTKTFLLTILYVPFTFLLFFSQTATAAPSETKAQLIPSPSMGEGQGEGVIFAKGLLTVQAKDIALKSLLDEIGKAAGIGVSVSPSLENNKVSVQFENLTLERGLLTFSIVEV